MFFSDGVNSGSVNVVTNRHVQRDHVESLQREREEIPALHAAKLEAAHKARCEAEADSHAKAEECDELRMEIAAGSIGTPECLSSAFCASATLYDRYTIF